MQFLYPSFLWALLALTIPIIIHLFNFKRYKTVYFSNNRFLQALQKKSKSFNKLKHWLILLSRLLALAALVLAFAQPFFPAKESEEANSAFASIYIDNSLSMKSKGLNGSLLEDARAEAVKLVNALPKEFKVQIITNDLNTKEQRFYSTSQAIRLIDEIEPSNAYHSISEIASQIKNSFQEYQEGQTLQLFILSDFQKSQFQNLVSLNDSLWKIKLVKLEEANPSSNLAIDSVGFEKPILQPGFDQTLKVQIKNYGKQNLDNVSIQLKINGELNSAQEFDISELEKKELIFVIRPQNQGIYEGHLSIDIGQPNFDNELFFSFKVDDPIRVLVIGDSNRKVFEKLYQDSIFKLEFSKLNQLSYGELGNYNLIVLNQLKTFPSGLGTALNSNLKMGKNIVFIPDFETLVEGQTFLKNLGFNSSSTLIQGDFKLNKIYWKDLIFENVFTAEPKNSRLPVLKNYFKSNQNGYCLLELENGDCMLSRKPLLEGQLLVFHSNFNEASGGIAKHSILVPIMLNSALFSSPKQSLYSASGRASGQKFLRQFPESDYPMAIEVGEKEIIPPQRISGLQTEIFSLPAEVKPGIYPVIENEAEIGKIAVNIDPRESDWSFWSHSEIKEILANSNAEVLNLENVNLSQLVSNNFNGYALWHWFLWAALLFLIIEITLLKLWN